VIVPTAASLDPLERPLPGHQRQDADWIFIRGQHLNEITRPLTVISTIFMPLTFVVGLYGMNLGCAAPRSP